MYIHFFKKVAKKVFPENQPVEIKYTLKRWWIYWYHWYLVVHSWEKYSWSIVAFPLSLHLSKAYRTVIPFSSIRQIRERKQIFPFDISVKKNNKHKTSPWCALSLMMSVVHMSLYRYKKGLKELFKIICNEEERESSSDRLYISISWGIQRVKWK